jgi:hypothetical protein
VVDAGKMKPYRRRPPFRSLAIINPRWFKPKFTVKPAARQGAAYKFWTKKAIYIITLGYWLRRLS